MQIDDVDAFVSASPIRSKGPVVVQRSPIAIKIIEDTLRNTSRRGIRCILLERLRTLFLLHANCFCILGYNYYVVIADNCKGV